MPTLTELARAVLELSKEDVVRIANRALEEGIPADVAIHDGLAAGMKLVGERFAQKVYFVPEVLVAGRALYAGMDVLAPHVTRAPVAEGTVVLAVVEGDFHDIGKNIVKLMAETSGLRVVDLGKNVPLDRIEAAALEENAELVGLSTLMTTTLDTMADAVRRLTTGSGVPVLVGGAAVTPAFAARIGAAGSAPDAAGAVEKMMEIVAEVAA